MKKISIILFGYGILLLFSFQGCQSDHRTNNKDPFNGSISLSGAFALYPMAVKWSEEYMKLHPGVRIDISAGGAGKGITDVLSGMVEIGMVSREINPREKTNGAYEIAVTRDAVVATMSANNPYAEIIRSRGLSKEKFQRIFLSSVPVTWGDLLQNDAQSKAMVYTRSDACGAAEMWAKFLGKNQETLQGIGVFGDPGMADAVKADKNGIGYNNINYAYDVSSRSVYPGLAVIPIDLNGNGLIESQEDFYGDLSSMMEAIKKGVYPSPPARDLYFVTKGKPQDPVLIGFMEWVLSEGQKMLEQSGYIPLPEEKKQLGLSRIK